MAAEQGRVGSIRAGQDWGAWWGSAVTCEARQGGAGGSGRRGAGRGDARGGYGRWWWVEKSEVRQDEN